MLRTIKIGAIIVLANVIGAQSVGAESLTWGVFRENAPDVSENLRNCWSQAMVSGLTINGELMAQHLSQDKAQAELQRLAKQGLCAAERTSSSWSARGQGQSAGGGSNANGSGSDWSDADRFGGHSHAGGSD
jgi:hypothetical protein